MLTNELLDTSAATYDTNGKLLTFPDRLAVEVKDLRKSYGKEEEQTDALIGVNLQVRHGEILGVLGPNGAGKTTLIEILEGLRTATAGTAEVLGVDVTDQVALKRLRSAMGVSMQNSVLPPSLTVSELLTFVASLYSNARAPSDLISLLGLEDKQNSRLSNLSGGQQQRVAVALALIGNPKLIFLDEPTSQLDPQARRTVWDLLLQQRSTTGAAVLVTTHQMEEAERLCDQIIVLDHGKILATGSPRELIDKYCPDKTVEFISSDTDGLKHLNEQYSVTAVRTNHNIVRITPRCVNSCLSQLLQLQQQGSIDFSEMRIETQTLEDVFLKLTGRRIRG